MEGEPNHPERQKAKWDQLAKPSSEELPIAVAEQIDIKDSSENGEEAASPEWVRKFLEKYWTQKKAEAPGFAKEEAADIRDINQ